MSLKKEIERYLVLVQSLETSFQIALESETLPPAFFDATRDLLDVLKEELDELEIFENQELTEKYYPDIRRLLSINDRFRFQRDLFAGSKEKMDEALDDLNGLNSIEEMFECLHGRFEWDWEDESVCAFKELLKKRFAEV
ncbi:hypothetical protein AGMMS50262_03030 [Bacteroidia bacterium]|nr:hypothetical protein AGMMS50262_03030 [Bacteroidia bacterium]